MNAYLFKEAFNVINLFKKQTDIRIIAYFANVCILNAKIKCVDIFYFQQNKQGKKKKYLTLDMLY